MKPNFYLYEKTALTLKTLAISFIFAGLSTSAFSQGSYTSLGVGYNIADYTMPGFSDLLDQINVANPGLTKSFTDDHNYSGFNLHMGFGNKKSCFTIQYARYNKKHTAEGIIPLISPNNATYSIGAHHNFFTFQYQVFPVRFIGLGVHFGYGYSTFKNEQKDLFFGEVNATVDKKGGGVYGINAAFLVPLGTGAQIRVQPAYSIAVYKMDMDNLPIIYLGPNHNAPTESKIKGLSIEASFDIKF
ncbi:MAG: hypothetical protein IPH94_21965 [Saprospiraceae bacterium]|nr:hypothetical protein [Saprospiraceae bacterium]MBK8111650.1 hypothetical protein [Saprospiraceae bacterium]